jgi:cytosine/adenosine deaminase-related metal-dependent hydrolase
MIRACRWLLPIDHLPLEGAWFETTNGVIRRYGQGAPPGPAVDLGDVAVMPGLVNAHTHLELSWMAGQVPPADSMDEWIRTLMRVRRDSGAAGEAAGPSATGAAIAAMLSTGTVLVGDISNSLSSPALLATSGLGGVVFHELLGFNVSAPETLLAAATDRLNDAAASVAASPTPVRLALAAHAPYSVSPALFRAIAEEASGGPLTVHLGESPEEVEFLRSGLGPFRRMLEQIGVWEVTWEPPMTGPVDYLATLGYLGPKTLVVHGVHLSQGELDRLRRLGSVLVTCPRSNLWVGAGMPPVSRFYAAGVRVAIGTDSLASVETLNMFDELAELRRIAPDVAAGSLLESATRIGAEALGFGASHGTIAAGKVAALVAVDVPADVGDVEEYLVGGVQPSAIRRVF